MSARLKRQFDCYDRLPPQLREMLANANFDNDATMFAEALDVGISADLLRSRFMSEEAKRLPVDNYVMYGPEHPGSAKSVQEAQLKYFHYTLRRYFWWSKL
jgi:hypothetical protein